jgi:hypothetical protein
VMYRMEAPKQRPAVAQVVRCGDAEVQNQDCARNLKPERKRARPVVCKRGVRCDHGQKQ